MTEHVTEWHDGDVVEVEFPRKDGTTNGKWYEYVRIDSWWPGDSSWSGQSDTQIMELLRNEHVRLVSCGLDRALALRPKQAEPVEPEPLPQEFWYAYAENGDAAHGVFASEIEALRYAVQHGMQVEKRTWGALW